MKKGYLVSIVLAILLGSCKKSNEFVIRGKITNAEEKYLYLDELRVASNVPVDSVKIKKDGAFEFRGKIKYPNFFLLRLNNRNFITLLVDTVEKIDVFGDAANFSHDYVVQGSPGSQLVQELNNRLTHTKHQMDSIQSRILIFRNRPDYQAEITKWENDLAMIRKKQIEYSTKFVLEHPFSLASVLALYQKFDESNYVIQDLHSLKVAASALHSIFPNSEHVKALYANTVRLMSQEENIKLKDFIEQNGTNSPDISLPNVNGRTIRLSSLLGKIVLVQFWSATDRNSRIQNQALVDLYKQYNTKGLEIYQVSVDTDRGEWLKGIDDDGLSWTNVGDMKGSVTSVQNYNIQSIPANYLLDREGKIIGRNLQGPALNQAVSKALR